VFGHATAEFVDVVLFVVLGALFTATTQTIAPRRDLTTLSGTRVASVLTRMPVATLLYTADCILSAAVPQNLIFAPALDGRARRGPRPSGGQRSVVTVRIALAVKIRPTTTMIRAAPI